MITICVEMASWRWLSLLSIFCYSQRIEKFQLHLVMRSTGTRQDVREQMGTNEGQMAIPITIYLSPVASYTKQKSMWK